MTRAGHARVGGKLNGNKALAPAIEATSKVFVETGGEDYKPV